LAAGRGKALAKGKGKKSVAAADDSSLDAKTRDLVGRIGQQC
jgi:hypothetical protein